MWIHNAKTRSNFHLSLIVFVVKIRFLKIFSRVLGSGHGDQREFPFVVFFREGGCACKEGDMQPGAPTLHTRLQILHYQTEGGDGGVGDEG